jgi:hypothetical protein
VIDWLPLRLPKAHTSPSSPFTIVTNKGNRRHVSFSTEDPLSEDPLVKTLYRRPLSRLSPFTFDYEKYLYFQWQDVDVWHVIAWDDLEKSDSADQLRQAHACNQWCVRVSRPTPCKTPAPTTEAKN